ncbi:hypothetical protein AB205_0095800, partial [Aquarana catesbeiana]
MTLLAHGTHSAPVVVEYTNSLERSSGTPSTDCNGKGYWSVLHGLLMLVAGGSILDGGDLFLQGGLLLLVGTYCCRGWALYYLGVSYCWERSTVEGWVYCCCLLESLLMLAVGRSVVAAGGSVLGGPLLLGGSIVAGGGSIVTGYSGPILLLFLLSLTHSIQITDQHKILGSVFSKRAVW